MAAEVQPLGIPESKVSDKEINFRAFEAKMKRELEAEREKSQKLQRELDEKLAAKEVEEDVEPYVDNKKLHRELNNFGRKAKEETKQDIHQTVQQALYEERRQMWLDQNPDFYDTMEKNASRFMEKAPELAKTILQMPDNFERAKLVYHNIKTLGIDKPEIKQPSIQDRVDANRRSPFYAPSTVGTAPYATMGDFSESGMKNAYEQMQKLKAGKRG